MASWDLEFWSEPTKKESVQEISPEEFQRLLSRAERRHTRRLSSDTGHQTSSSGTQSVQKGATPDPVVPQRWRNHFDSTVIERLRETEIIPASPDKESIQFVTQTLGGDTRSLSDYDNQWVLLNFWATWCIPCRREMPSLNQLHGRMQNLTVIGVNIGEPPSTIRPFVKQRKLTFPVLLDQSGSIASKFGTHYIPETWLIGPSGKVFGVVQGPREWNSRKLTQLFESFDLTRMKSTNTSTAGDV